MSTAAPGPTWDDLPLAENHRVKLMKSGISPEVAAERGYRTETTISKVRRYGFTERQCQMPGMLIPIYNVNGELVSYQFNSDAPRSQDGKIVKYESIPRHPSEIDVPPRARAWVFDPEQPLVFTESAKKGDAGATHELAVLDIAGVWNWRSPEVIASLDQITFKERTVYLAFDSDVVRKKDVRYAEKRLAAVLRQRGATTYGIRLPEHTPGVKVGLDDWLANGGSRIGLFKLELVELTADEGEPEREEASGPYVSTPSGIVYRKPTPNGTVDQPLTNFNARIIEEVIADDGATERAEFVIAGDLAGEPFGPMRVTPRRFAGMDWPYDLGARYRVSAGMGAKDRAREAIQCLSPEITRRHVYEHTGWRRIDVVGWSYLHANGAIGPIGPITDIDVALSGTLARLILPDPPDDMALRAAVRACLSLLDLAPDRITVPLFGAVWRAVLCEMAAADIGLFLVGPTGVFKSELAALAMAYFGAGYNRLHLSATWSATANFLERAAFDSKDTLLVIDDFAPGGSAIDVSRAHATADRVFRGAGNRGGRGRMNADGTLRPDYPPRGIIIGTGEDVPRGQSLRARIGILDVAPGDVDVRRLSTAQALAQQGTLAAGMAGYLRWMAEHFDAFSRQIPGKIAEYRDLAYRDSGHARTPEAVAHLAVGWTTFLGFAEAVGAVTPSEAQAMCARVWAALGEMATRQTQHQATEEPARRFLDLLGSALAGGFAHVASSDGGTPHPSERWGWRRVLVGAGDHQSYDWREQGTRIGWIDGDDLYLDLEAALTAAQRVGQATGSGVAVGAKTLAKRLHERGYVRSIDTERDRVQVRRTLQGGRRYVLHLAADTLIPQESAQSAQSAHGEEEPTAQRQSANGSGSIPWADCSGADQQSAHKTGPSSASYRGDGPIGPIGPVFQP